MRYVRQGLVNLAFFFSWGRMSIGLVHLVSMCIKINSGLIHLAILLLNHD